MNVSKFEGFYLGGSMGQSGEWLMRDRLTAEVWMYKDSWAYTGLSNGIFNGKIPIGDLIIIGNQKLK